MTLLRSSATDKHLKREEHRSKRLPSLSMDAVFIFKRVIKVQETLRDTKLTIKGRICMNKICVSLNGYRSSAYE